MKVWTLLITHRHGTNVSVYLKKENAEKELIDYVRDRWGNWLEEKHGAFGTVDPDEAIQIYFDDSYDEWYELDEALVVDAEEG